MQAYDDHDAAQAGHGDRPAWPDYSGNRTCERETECLQREQASSVDCMVRAKRCSGAACRTRESRPSEYMLPVRAGEQRQGHGDWGGDEERQVRHKRGICGWS